MKVLFVVIEDYTCAFVGVYGDRATANCQAAENGGSVLEIGVDADGKTYNINKTYSEDMTDIQ